MKNIKTLFFIVGIAIFSLLSCQKDLRAPASLSSNKLTVFITDAPISFEHAFIDLKMLEVKIERDSCASLAHDANDDNGSHTGSDDHGGGNGNGGSEDNGNEDHGGSSSGDHSSCELWDTLQINAGVYDLLEFRNGVDALLASGAVPKGEIKSVRLTLGNNNSVVLDGNSFPLILGSNTVEVKIEDIEKSSSDDFQLHLDFDLANSITRTRDDRFELSPKVKSFDDKKGGKIEGAVFPKSAKPIVTLYGNKDTLVAMPGNEGEYKIRGIKSTSFNLKFSAATNGYADTTLLNISLNPGQELRIPAITLHR